MAQTPMSLQEKLRERNLRKREVGPDGNSFFNAVSEALAYTTNTPTQLKEKLVKHLKTFQDIYYLRSTATTVEEYLHDPLLYLSSNILPEAMARTLRMQIQIIPANPEQEDKCYGTEPVIQLIHDKTEDIDHYDYVLPITSPEDTTNTSEASPPSATETPLKSRASEHPANESRRKLFPDKTR